MGKSCSPKEKELGYPRICAHRGVSNLAPENTIPAFDLAVNAGAQEIEFDVYATKDGKLVVIHDYRIEYLSDGVGKIWEFTYDELLKFDFGYKFDEKYRGLKIATFEEVLAKYSKRVIMNIHVKIWDWGFEDDKMAEIISLVKKYDCQEYVYFATGRDEVIVKLKSLYPQFPCAILTDQERPYKDVERAIAVGAEKIQSYHFLFNEDMIKQAKQNGIIINIFKCDDIETAKKYFETGIDCILTDNFMELKIQ